MYADKRGEIKATKKDEEEEEEEEEESPYVNVRPVRCSKARPCARIDNSRCGAEAAWALFGNSFI